MTGAYQMHPWEESGGVLWGEAFLEGRCECLVHLRDHTGAVTGMTRGREEEAGLTSQAVDALMCQLPAGGARISSNHRI